MPPPLALAGQRWQPSLELGQPIQQILAACLDGLGRNDFVVFRLPVTRTRPPLGGYLGQLRHAAFQSFGKLLQGGRAKVRGGAVAQLRGRRLHHAPLGPVAQTQLGFDVFERQPAGPHSPARSRAVRLLDVAKRCPRIAGGLCFELRLRRMHSQKRDEEHPDGCRRAAYRSSKFAPTKPRLSHHDVVPIKIILRGRPARRVGSTSPRRSAIG